MSLRYAGLNRRGTAASAHWVRAQPKGLSWLNAKKFLNMYTIVMDMRENIRQNKHMEAIE